MNRKCWLILHISNDLWKRSSSRSRARQPKQVWKAEETEAHFVVPAVSCDLTGEGPICERQLQATNNPGDCAR